MKHKTTNKKIIVAPLNWGLGHAIRCIPIINALIKKGFKPIIAGDGDSLKVLQKEFSKLKSYTLPSYDIRYTKKGSNLKYKLLYHTPRILKIVKKEQKVVEEIIKKEHIHGIISDNRFGVRSHKVPSVYITHQINVLSGMTTFFTSKFHQNIISKFDECWVPDYKDSPNLAGELSHSNNTSLNLKYIGPISRFKFVISSNPDSNREEISNSKIYDIMILLSGLEPQRTLLEDKLINELKTFPKKVLFVRGILSDKEVPSKNKNVEIVNFMEQKALRKSILDSEIILARSGYSTIMDLEKLGAKAFLIPTPGQFEQEYLAKYLEQQKIAPFATQNDFNLSLLKNMVDYTGFIPKNKSNKEQNLFPFDVFQK